MNTLATISTKTLCRIKAFHNTAMEEWNQTYDQRVGSMNAIHRINKELDRREVKLAWVPLNAPVPGLAEFEDAHGWKYN